MCVCGAGRLSRPATCDSIAVLAATLDRAVQVRQSVEVAAEAGAPHVCRLILRVREREKRRALGSLIINTINTIHL